MLVFDCHLEMVLNAVGREGVEYVGRERSMRQATTSYERT